MTTLPQGKKGKEREKNLVMKTEGISRLM